jgi:hypothetical protein
VQIGILTVHREKKAYLWTRGTAAIGSIANFRTFGLGGRYQEKRKREEGGKSRVLPLGLNVKGRSEEQNPSVSEPSTNCYAVFFL